MTTAIPEVIDLQFALRGRSVPLDHADALWQSVRAVLPWLEEETLAGIHPLYGLSPGAGEWYLSRRGHLVLRLPPARVADARALTGVRLDLGAEALEVGVATEKAWTHTPVVYARFVALNDTDGTPPDEGIFFESCRQALAKLGLAPRSLLCGKRQTARTSTGVLHGFSLMVNGLDEADTRRLLTHGIGVERKRGCGIFNAHKSHPADGTLE